MEISKVKDEENEQTDDNNLEGENERSMTKILDKVVGKYFQFIAANFNCV
jgi:hypothetical protein